MCILMYTMICITVTCGKHIPVGENQPVTTMSERPGVL